MPPSPLPPTPSEGRGENRAPLAAPVAEPLLSRRKVGVLAIVCLALSGLLKLAGPDQAGLMSALFRVGTVLAALWLALPPQGQPVLWRNFTPVLVIALAFTLLAKNPKMLVIAIPIGFAVLLLLSLGPRRPHRPARKHK